MVPFLEEFYTLDKDAKPVLETEISFVLVHYNQIKEAFKNYQGESFILADFSIEKDYAYAQMNLNKDEFKIFKTVYDFVIQQIGIPHTVIYIDLSLKMLKRRIFQRGRFYEMDTNPIYFKKYSDELKNFFKEKSNSQVYFFDVSDLDLEQENKKLTEIENKILEII